MSHANDLWYVRLPDGQIVRANSTDSVRHHLETGRIPRDSWVRRSPDEEWVSVEWAAELGHASAAVPAGKRTEPGQRDPAPQEAPEPAYEAPITPPSAGRTRARQERMQLQLVGARGMVDEMLKAVDSTFNRTKLRVACAAGLACALLIVLPRMLPLGLEWPLSLLPWCVAALGTLIVMAIGTALIAQTSFVELSTAKAAGWRDSNRSLLRNAGRLFLCYLVVIGTPLILLLVMQAITGWLPTSDLAPSAREGIAGSMLLVAILLVVLLGPALAFAQILGPIVVIDEASAGTSLRQWWRFVRQHFGRLYFYEASALTMGMIAALPLLLPTLWAGHALAAATGGGLWSNLAAILVAALDGVAWTPLIAYMAVVNVFIYLNLRYEVAPSK